MTKTSSLANAQQCNICDGKEFGGGPGGRMSYDGVTSPRCTTCQSLERHRAFRAVFDQLRDKDFESASVLQFSADSSNDPEWFGSHEVSEYEGLNPLDLQAIDRANGSYDIVVCNHVIEHVADDRSAMRELVRVTKDTGFVFLSFPDPLRLETTNEWGYPDDKQHGHYRLYGKDVRSKFKEELPGVHVYAVVGEDPCTGSTEALWLITACKQRARWIEQQLPQADRIDTGDSPASNSPQPDRAPNVKLGPVFDRALNPPTPFSMEIGPADNMACKNPDRYIAIGQDAMRAIGFAMSRADVEVPKSVLDFACGWGRVSRHLRASFPDAHLVCADIWKDAVSFASKAFDAQPMYLSSDPNTYEIQTGFDLIWCGSLITHLTEVRARRVIDMFCNALNPNGVALFTTHGRYVRDRRAEGRYKYNVSDAALAMKCFDNDDYGFVPYEGQTDYGFSLTPARWVLDEILSRPDMKLVQYSERGWDDHQDVVAIQRTGSRAVDA